MRRVERVIDQSIESQPIWRARAELLIHRVLEYYRDAIEVVFLNVAIGAQIGDGQSVSIGIALERQLHAGVLWALKWTLEYAQGASQDPVPDEDIDDLVELGWRYEILVDALKMARYDLLTISLDEEQKSITVYEGGDLTGSDAQLVSHQHTTLPFRGQVPLIDDNDQLTSRWTAGDFRKLTERLAIMAKIMEKEEIISALGGEKTPLFHRPVILELPNLSEPGQQAALEDLTLTSQKVRESKYLFTAWLDVPCVMISSRRLAASNVVKALTGAAQDDYMLRVAARCDKEQYSKVSGLREDRMIAQCESVLKSNGWRTKPRYLLTDPPNEVDVYAERQESHLILQLKSTLRPETPWEVYKRNTDVEGGIAHTAEMVRRFPEGTLGFVITDGYRGDYSTWAKALAVGIAIGTTEDIEDIAKEPIAAIDMLKSRVGFHAQVDEPFIRDRVIELVGWTIRLTDKRSQ